jgi:hypothetical protein
VATDIAPTVEEVVPTGQFVHVNCGIPDTTSYWAYVPALQATQDSALLAPDADEVPVVQFAHNALPTIEAYVPLPHDKQPEEPDEELNVPVSHEEHTDWPALLP